MRSRRVLDRSKRRTTLRRECVAIKRAILSKHYSGADDDRILESPVNDFPRCISFMELVQVDSAAPDNRLLEFR